MHAFPFELSLRFFSQVIDPSEISSQLGLEPQWEHKMGDLRTNPRGIVLGEGYDSSYCSFPITPQKTKKIWDDLDFDDPNPGLKHGNGRLCQVRYKKKPIIRLDYQPYPGTKGKSRLHLDLDSLDIKHVPLDPRRLFDD